MNIVYTSSFSPYSWDSTGATIDEYAIKDKGTLGRFINSSVNTGITLTSKESRKKLENTVDNLANQWDADLQYYILHPEHAIDFNIPWKATISHIYSVRANQNTSGAITDAWIPTQTLSFVGDLSFTRRWKIVSNMNLNLETAEITNASFTLTRDMHCWALQFFWTPIGGNQSFLFTIRSTSTLFQDAKIQIRKPPTFF